ncbi:hypothetical protein ACP4OV_015728 [Aristida adscensionis]
MATTNASTTVPVNVNPINPCRNQAMPQRSQTPRRHATGPLVMLSACLVVLGAGGPLHLRVYFVHGGRRLWLSTMMQLSGCQLLPPRLAGAVAALGGFFAVACYVYSRGAQALPVSTSSLLLATQLSFNAVFAFLLVGLRFTPFSANAVVLLTVGPAVLGVGPSSGKPAGEDSGAYWTGFFEAISAAAMFGVGLPLMEVATSRYGRRRSEPAAAAAAAARKPPPYVMVMQIQAVMGAAGTAVCLVGMAVTGDFQAMRGEAAGFGLGGRSGYYLVFALQAVSWQLFNLGVMGLVICASSLLAGVMIAVLLPLSEILAVILLHERFDGTKGIALVLSLWGFVSYLYGESAQKKTETTMHNRAAKRSGDQEPVALRPLVMSTV